MVSKMKWLKNLESIALSKEPGECPICKSKNTDYGFTMVVKETNMGFGAIWCNDCHNGYHISRIKIEKDMKLQSVPEGIKYT